MGLFNCSKCGVIENTATGFYWTAKRMSERVVFDSSNIEFKGMPLCSECAPSKYTDGTNTMWGKWHNRFKKEYRKLS